MQEVKHARCAKQGLQAGTGVTKVLTREDSGTSFSNRGATGVVTFTLPVDAEAGDKFTFNRIAAFDLRFAPGAGKAVRCRVAAVAAGARQLQAVNKYIGIQADSTISIEFDGTDWVATTQDGAAGAGYVIEA